MSNPLSNLKKTKHNPLLGQPQNHHNGSKDQSNVPYRYGDDSLLGEVTTRMARQAPSSKLAAADPVPSDIDLMQTMISRIALLEKTIQLQTKQINDKDRRINVLENKCQLYQRMNSECPPTTTQVKELEARCLLLQQQISDMEEFLLDYGMVWVGLSLDDEESEVESDDESTLSQGGGVWSPSRSIPGTTESGGDNDDASSHPFQLDNNNSGSSSNPYTINFDAIIENIKELNTLAGEGETKIERTSLGARFKVPDAVQLTLYQNGLVMFDGPFRPYTDRSTHICLADILDGYFPTELQHRYPDGVPFKVSDKRSVIFSQTQADRSFTGHGQSLGGDAAPSRLVPSILNASDQSLSKAVQLVETQLPVRHPSYLRQISQSVFSVPPYSHYQHLLQQSREQPRVVPSLLAVNEQSPIP